MGTGGLLTAIDRNGLVNGRLAFVDPASGKERVVTDIDEFLLLMTIDPTGRKAAGIQGTVVALIDLERGTVQKLREEGTFVSEWMPGNLGLLASVYADRGSSNIIRIDPDGVSPVDTVIATSASDFYGKLSPDRKTILFYTVSESNGRDLWVVPVRTTDTDIRLQDAPRLWYGSPGDDVLPNWSPSGNWVMYASNRSGEYEIYLRSWPSARNEINVSNGSGTNPAWSPDGKQIYFRSSESLFIVDVLDETTMRLSRPRVLFSLEEKGFIMGSSLDQSYAVNPVTGELLMNQIYGNEAEPRIVFIENWKGLIKR